MEGNIVNEVITPEPIQTKRCKICGKEKPITEFAKRGQGRETICLSCKSGEGDTSEKFKNFTSRELIEELRHRGYRGALKLVIEKEVVI